MFIWIHDRFWIEWIDPEHRESLIREPLSIFDRGFTVNSWDLIAEDMLRPFDLLIDRGLKHTINKSLIVNIWKFATDFFHDIREECHVGEFITSYVRDHASGRWHLHVIDERVEESKTIIKVEAFEEEIRDNASKEVMI